MEHEHQNHGGSIQTYNLVFLVLFVVTILELVASEISGIPGHVFLIGLTVTKFWLVAAYYMHLKYDPPILTWIFVVPLVMAVGVVLSLQGLAGY